MYGRSLGGHSGPLEGHWDRHGPWGHFEVFTCRYCNNIRFNTRFFFTCYVPVYAIFGSTMHLFPKMIMQIKTIEFEFFRY